MSSIFGALSRHGGLQYCSNSRKVFSDWSTNYKWLQRSQPNKIAYAVSRGLLLCVTFEKIQFSRRETYCTSVRLPIDWKRGEV